MVAKVTRDGRIVFWEGGSLWAFDVLPDLQNRTNKTHSHHAVQLSFAAGGSVGIWTTDGLVPGPVILVAPDVPHALQPEGKIAHIFVDPESRSGARLKEMLDGRSAIQLHGMPDFAAELALLWELPIPSDIDMVGLGQTILSRAIGRVIADQAFKIDRRVLRVLSFLGDPEVGEMTLSEAADIACLSESRFSHLFVEEVGLPFRTFLLWRRMSRAVSLLSSGNSLTEAAHDAGFADSAHFSRTFLRMFGLPAAALELAPPKISLPRAASVSAACRP